MSKTSKVTWSDSTPIYFLDEQHAENFIKFPLKFPRVTFDKNGQYRATCYIAAVPEVFKCFNLDAQVHGPFDWLFEFYEDPGDFQKRAERGETTGRVGALTSQTWALCKIGLSLWNGRDCDIGTISDMDPAMYLVVLQALDLRRRAPSFDYSAYDVRRVDDWYDKILRKQD